MADDLTREILLQVAAGRVPSEEVCRSPEISEELRLALIYLREIERFGIALCKGDLSAQLNARGSLAGGLKGLHAGLRHLTWQTKQVADGDLSQHVDFMGEFSAAFNTMVDKLRESRGELCKKNYQLEQAYAELKETQSQMLQKEKMASIGQLAAGVAHEINNPIGFISSNLGTLGKYTERITGYIHAQKEILESLGRFEELEELRKQIKLDYIIKDMPQLVEESLDGAVRVMKIVQNLKTFSRLDEAEWKPANINDCLESTLNIVWNELKYKAEVIKEFASLPDLKCNPAQLSQVFMNLLVNAAHAIEKQGMITVRSWKEDGFIRVEISDTGCGIPEAIRGKIFEPFFTTKEVGKGTGLGLSISYDIVKKHGGEITVESELGKGTLFRVRLPFDAASE